MIEFASQILNGLAIGNVYALLALGFSLVFGVANLINFAQGSLFMVGAYIGWTGVALWGLPFSVALLLAVGATALLGLIIDGAGLRPLQGGPMIAPLLSTLAISVVLDQAAQLIWSPATQSFPNPLSGIVWHVGGAYISAVDVLIFVAGTGAMAALTLFLNRTWTGRAIRSTAQDPEAALQMGVDVSKIRQFTFGLASALGGLGGVLMGMYYQSIFPTMGLPYGLKGFTAALLGGITSIPGSIAGGLLLGIFESLASGYLGTEYRDMIAYALLLVVLLWRPQGLLGSRVLSGLGGAQGAAGAIPGSSPLAAASGVMAVPLVRSRHLSGRQMVALGVAALFLPVLVPQPYVLHVAAMAIIFAILSVGLTLISGSAGQISLGHAALFGVGAYTTAILARSYGLPLESVLLIAGLLTAAVGVLSALPTLRLSGHEVVVATLAVGQILHLIFLTWIPVTRGPMGIPGIPPPELAVAGGVALWNVRDQYWLAVVALGALIWLSRRLLSSPIGRAWRAIREDRLAAQAAGLPVKRYLAMAFGSGAFLAGVAGALYAYLLTFISPDSFATDTAIILLTTVVLGGLGNVTGAILGGVIVAVIPELFRGFADYRMVAYGLAMLLIIRFRPQGIAGTD